MKGELEKLRNENQQLRVAGGGAMSADDDEALLATFLELLRKVLQMRSDGRFDQVRLEPMPRRPLRPVTTGSHALIPSARPGTASAERCGSKRGTGPLRRVQRGDGRAERRARARDVPALHAALRRGGVTGCLI